MSECETLIEDFEWGPFLVTARATVYFTVSEYHPATRWQPGYGGEISLHGLAVDSATIFDDGDGREATLAERLELGRVLVRELADQLVDECYESVA